MKLTELYEKGADFFKDKEYGRLLGYVETGFIRQNDRLALDRYTFRQRCIDAVVAQTECRVLGVTLRAPVIMSSMTMPIPSVCEEGMMKTARGLKAAGSLLWTGTPIPKNLRELSETGVPLAANVKPHSDRKKMHAEVEEILSAGVAWLGLEIDAGRGTKIVDREMGYSCTPFSAKEIEQIKTKSDVPLVCKGVLSREDAEKCVGAGADAIVISNHGGHTLDYLPHPFQVMDEVVPTVKGKAVVMVDGGFRRGSDVLKGLAFGADVVGLGRPVLYALAAHGENGVKDLILEISKELARLMTMVGAPDPGSVRRDILIDEQFR